MAHQNTPLSPRGRGAGGEGARRRNSGAVLGWQRRGQGNRGDKPRGSPGGRPGRGRRRARTIHAGPEGPEDRHHGHQREHRNGRPLRGPAGGLLARRRRRRRRHPGIVPDFEPAIAARCVRVGRASRPIGPSTRAARAAARRTQTPMVSASAAGAPAPIAARRRWSPPGRRGASPGSRRRPTAAGRKASATTRNRKNRRWRRGRAACPPQSARGPNNRRPRAAIRPARNLPPAGKCPAAQAGAAPRRRRSSATGSAPPRRRGRGRFLPARPVRPSWRGQFPAPPAGGNGPGGPATGRPCGHRSIAKRPRGGRRRGRHAGWAPDGPPTSGRRQRPGPPVHAAVGRRSPGCPRQPPIARCRRSPRAGPETSRSRGNRPGAGKASTVRPAAVRPGRHSIRPPERGSAAWPGPAHRSRRTRIGADRGPRGGHISRPCGPRPRRPVPTFRAERSAAAAVRAWHRPAAARENG